MQSTVFNLCRHLCSKSANAVIHGIINFMWVRMNTMLEESEDASNRAGVDTGIQNYYSYWKYDQHNHFHQKMSFEQVRNIQFCSGLKLNVNYALLFI